MNKRSRVTQELVNYFPSWSRVRSNDQSIGFQFFNELAKPMDTMDHYLERMKFNTFLSTVNLDEIDWLYKVQLPTTFSFVETSEDPLSPVPTVPIVRGLVENNTFTGYVNVTLAENNDITSLWYDAVPTRVDLEETITGVSDRLLSQKTTLFPYEEPLFSHLQSGENGGSKLWIEVSSGTQYVTIEDGGDLSRGTVVLTGITKKGTEETETLIFPWNEKRSTLKEWSELSKVEIFDMEDTVNVDIRSADFNFGPCWAFYNLRQSDIDTKIDEFWTLGETNTGSTLDRTGFVSDEWQNIMLGFSETAVKNSWELLDSTESPVTLLDITVQPFTERVWGIADDAKLYCYSIDETVCSGVDYLIGRTSGSNVRLEFEDKYVVLGDDIIFTPLLIRPVQDLDKYRIWYQLPTGSKSGLLNGSPVAFSSDFWVYSPELKREIEGPITITPALRGEYIFTLEAVFADGTTHIDKVIIPVQYKLPLTTINLSSILAGQDIQGIDFDSDQQLWIKTVLGYYRFSLHSDLMLIDYNDKVMYFREKYSDIEVTV